MSKAKLAPLAMQACTLLPEQTAPPAPHGLSCTMGAPVVPNLLQTGTKQMKLIGETDSRVFSKYIIKSGIFFIF